MPVNSKSGSSPADHWALIARVVVAAVGGYGFAAVSGIFVARLLPMERPDAVLAMTLASFGIYAAAVIYVFAARTTARACFGLLVPTAVLAALVLLMGPA